MHFIVTSPLPMRSSTVMSLSVNLFFCLSVSAVAYLRNHKDELYQIFVIFVHVACAWLWLGPLAAL